MTATPGIVFGNSTKVYDLEQPRYQGMPIHEAHQPGYFYSLYRRHSDANVTGPSGPRSSASGVVTLMEHAGTHIDALCHQAENQKLHDDIDALSVMTPKGFSRHGVETIVPIVAPGKLLDVAGFRGVGSMTAGEAINADELKACAASQEITIEPGDVVLVRTGNGKHWHQPSRYLPGPGVDGSGSQLMADLQVLAVGADTMAWDVMGLFDESTQCELPGHIILLVRAGIYIIENLDLEALAADQQFSFTFVCLPLKMIGATGSPVRPIAIAN